MASHSDTDIDGTDRKSTYDYDPKDSTRPEGLLTPSERDALNGTEPFTGRDAFANTDAGYEEIIERLQHALVDFHLVAVAADQEMREEILYEGRTASEFNPEIPSAGEAAAEDLIALLYLGVHNDVMFEELLTAGIERAHHLRGEVGEVSVTTDVNIIDTAEDIAICLDEDGVDAVSPRDLQLLYFADIITKDEYRELMEKKFSFLSD